MLDLARVTLEEWDRAILAPTAASGARVGENLLIQREEALLTLKDIERTLMDQGTEGGVVRDLIKWINASSRFFEGEARQVLLLDYLDGVTAWLDPFVIPDENLSLRRVTLQADAHSDYPALVLELGGDPQRMGRTVWSHTRNHPGWSQLEMDLVDGGFPSGWWMRGLYLYADKSLP